MTVAEVTPGTYMEFWETIVCREEGDPEESVRLREISLVEKSEKWDSGSQDKRK